MLENETIGGVTFAIINHRLQGGESPETVAKFLGIPRPRLLRWLKKLGVKPVLNQNRYWTLEPVTGE